MSAAVATPPVTTPARDGRRTAAFVGVTAGNFLVLLDTSILYVALPDVARDLHVGSSLVPWPSVVYTVVFAGLLLAAGAVSDRFGARRLYRSSLVAFAAMSLLCAAAPAIGWLIAGRALLGVAAAGMVPASVALLASLYPDPAARAKAIGTWAALSSSGLLAGPVLGGVLVTAGGWRLVFLVNPPLALVSFLLARRFANTLPDTPRPLDLPGIVLSTVALGTLSFGFIDGGTVGWDRVPPIASLAVAAAALVALVVVERRVDHPVLPPEILRSPAVRVDVLAAAGATLVFYGILFTLTLWYERVRGLSALETGLAFIPMTLPMCVLPMVTGRLVAFFGARRLIIIGLGFDVLAGILLSFVDVHSALAWIVLAEIALVLASTSVIPAATADVAINAPRAYAASAQGALNAARQAGAALGVAILGPLATLRPVGLVLAALSVALLTLTVSSTLGSSRKVL
jgi:DHA2 family methylenomycin A resistance protein-like MFS transporter